MDDARDALITARAAMLGISLEPAWCAAIQQNLDVTVGHAAHVGEFALPDAAEPAPVFRA